MYDKLLRALRGMELEEKVLHSGALVCIVSLVLPWIGGQTYGTDQQWNGFGFHTGFIGHFVLLLQILIISMTLSPLLGGPIIVRKSKRCAIRFVVSILSTVLLISAFTIILRLTSEVSGVEIRFGMYFSIVGSAVTTLYTFLRYQEELQAQNQALFHHPDELSSMKNSVKPEPKLEETLPPLPPPPTPPPLEEHTIYKS
jgi:hypothetical protein